MELRCPLPCERGLTLHDRFVDRAGRAAGQANQTVGMAREHVEGHMRLGTIRGIEKSAAREPHEVAIAALVLGEEDEGGKRLSALSLPMDAIGLVVGKVDLECA